MNLPPCIKAIILQLVKRKTSSSLLRLGCIPYPTCRVQIKTPVKQQLNLLPAPESHLYLLPVPFPIRVQTGCPTGWTSVHGGSCYQARTQRYKTFSDAVRDCTTTSGAYLVQLQSKSENDFVAGLSVKDLWIGYKSQSKKGPWLWNIANQGGQYSNWFPGEPSYTGDPPYCALIWNEKTGGGNKQWGDIWCHHHKSFVCEAGMWQEL